jgi:hypothetical protein
VFFKNARGLDNDGYGRLTLLHFHQYSREQRSIWYIDIDENKVWLYKIKYLSGFSDLVRLVKDHGLKIGGQTNAYLDPKVDRLKIGSSSRSSVLTFHINR